MRRWLTTLLLLLLAVVPALADGPETGTLEGTVTDASGSPLPGVTVALQGGRGGKVAVTEADGSYRFALLTPGEYTVKASLEGLGEAEGIATVAAGKKANVDMQLAMGTAETITVTSEAPLVDKYNVGAGQVMQSKVGEEVTSVNRSYYGVVNFMPGVTSDAENVDLDGNRPNINGSTWADSTVYIDGVDTTFSRYGGSRVFLPASATTEVSLESGGLSAEYGRTVGSATNVIVKSGTNQYHGDLKGLFTSEDWNAESDDQPSLTNRQTRPFPADFLRRVPEEKDNDATQYEAALGGPIKRDKAWFFVSWNENNTNNVEKVYNGDVVDASQISESRIVKLNFQPAQSHQIAVSWIDTPVLRNFILEPVFDPYGVTPHDISGELYTGNWNWSISSDLFLETKLASQTSNENKLLAFGGLDVNAALAVKQSDPRFPPNPNLPPNLFDSWPGNNFGPYIGDGFWHNGWLLDNGFGINKFPRDQLNAAFTHFASANHELKYGLDAQEVEWNGDVRRLNLYSGQGDNIFSAFSPTGYVDENLVGTGLENSTALNTSCDFLPGASSGSCILQDYNHPDLLADLGTNDTLSQNIALYFRDRFTVGDHWTFNVGVRAEQQTHENDIDREVMDSTDISPRASVAYDLKGDGKQLITGFVGRSFHQLPQQAINEYLQDQFNGYNGYERRLYCSPTNSFLASLGFLGATCRGTGVGYTSTLGFIKPGGMWDLVDQGVFESDLEAYHKDEAILGYEWQFSRNWALDAKAIWWEVDNLIGSTLQLAELDGALTIFTLTANHKDYPTIMNAVREAASPANQAALAQAATLDRYVEPYRDYQALQIQLNRRFANSWALFTNVTLSEAGGSSHGDVFNNTNDSYGENLEQVMTQTDIDTCQSRQPDRTVPIDCQAAWGPHIGDPLSIINREGIADFDRTWIAKALGYKVFNITPRQTFTLGGLVTWQTGKHWERTEGAGGSNPTGLPLEIGVTVPIENEGDREMSSHWWANLSLAYGFPISSDRFKGELRAEINNVTDNQDQINISGLGEARAIRRDFQRPRSIRLLAGISF